MTRKQSLSSYAPFSTPSRSRALIGPSAPQRRSRACRRARSRAFSLFGVQPHRTKSFKLSTDPLFVDKVKDIVGLYLNPPDNAIVLCVDEKSHVWMAPGSQEESQSA